MKHCRGIIIIVGFAAAMVFLPGCVPIPDYSSGHPFVYLRYNETNTPIEAIIKVDSSFDWEVPLTPEGPHVLDAGQWEKTHYYYSDRRVRRRPLHFLNGQNDNQWELIAPVAATNRWVRLQGWKKMPGWTDQNKYTNRVAVTVFTPRELLYRQTILTTDIPETNYVHLLEGNGVVRYKSEHDDFTYDVMQGMFETAK